MKESEKRETADKTPVTMNFPLLQCGIVKTGEEFNAHHREMIYY